MSRFGSDVYVLKLERNVCLGGWGSEMVAGGAFCSRKLCFCVCVCVCVCVFVCVFVCADPVMFVLDVACRLHMCVTLI